MARHLAAVLITIVIAGAFASAAMAVPACDPAQTAALPMTNNLDPVTPLNDAPIAYASGSLASYGFDIEFVVDPSGHVTCADIIDTWGDSGVPPGDSAHPVVTPQRQAKLDEVAKATFPPYLVSGQPSAVYADLFFQEEQQPKSHVDAPHGDLASVHIHQDWTRGPISWPASYALDIYGDGRVVYTAGDAGPIGVQTYHIDPAAVQALIDKAAATDFWSYDDDALATTPPATDTSEKSPQPHFVEAYPMDTPIEGTSIDYGGQRHRLGYAADMFGGRPRALDQLQDAIADAAHVVDWWNFLSPDALDLMQRNGFDFKGQQGSDLLVFAFADNVPEPGIEAVIARAAPVLWSPADDDGRPASPLTAALETGHPDLARAMIAGGALLVDGKPDRARVNAAFLAALQGGTLDGVQMVMPYQPDMTAPDSGSGEAAVSVLFWLADQGDKPDAAAITELLIAHGAPADAHRNGMSILSVAAQNGQAGVAKALLAHGAAPNGIASDDTPPLAAAQDEDMVLLLLDAGADPARLDKDSRDQFYGSVADNHWTRVAAWLAAYGRTIKPDAG